LGLWASAQLFENTLLGVIGPKGWTDLFSGEMHWDNPRVREAMNLFAKMQDYVNPDQAVKTLMRATYSKQESLLPTPHPDG
jgi:glucose/mannose transport system substrate-binding protein